MGLFNRLKRLTASQSNSSTPARFMTGPDDVKIFAPARSLPPKLKPGETVRMRVMPCAVTLTETHGNMQSSWPMEDGSVALAYDGKPCCFMRDATGTLMELAKESAIELDVTCRQDGQYSTLYAKWNWYSDEQRAERAARQAELERADAQQFHLRVNFEDWNGGELLDDEYFDAVELTADGDTIHVSSGSKVLFDAVPGMKYYDVAKERLGIPVTKMRARPKTEVKKPYIRVDFYYREKNW